MPLVVWAQPAAAAHAETLLVEVLAVLVAHVGGVAPAALAVAAAVLVLLLAGA